jgi:hypothetical protein
LCCLVSSCLIVHLVLSDHFSPLFPLLKNCVTIPCISTHLVWCLRHSARIIIIIIIIIFIIHHHGHGIIDYPVYRFACIGLGLGLGLAFVVEFGHGRSWQPLGLSPLYLSLLCCHGAWQCTTKSIYIHLLGPWAALQDHGDGVIFRAFVGRLVMSRQGIPLSLVFSI